MRGKPISNELKQEIIRKHFSEGRTIKSLCDEYSLSHSSIEKCITDYRKECLSKPEQKQQLDIYEENLKLKKELEELQKENAFLKKVAAFFAKEND